MNEWTSCWCFGTPVGAPALLLVLWHSCCVRRHSCCLSRHVLIGAPALLLVLRHSCCVSRNILIGAPELQLVLRHSYCVRRHVRPDWCSGTPAGATTLLLSEQARPDRCSGTLLLVLRHSCSVLYLRVLIILLPTHFL